MTKYDLKMQRRKEEEIKKKKRSQRYKAAAIAIVAVCVGVSGWKAYEKYDEVNGAYIKIASHDIKKVEYDYYFNSSINSFVASYGSYLSYFGLDTSKPLDQQYYSDNMTWKDYFDQQAVEQMKNVYTLSDEADEKGFEYDPASDYSKFETAAESNAKAQDMSTDDYCKATYGDYATLKKLQPFVELSGKAAAYYASVQDATEVTEDDIKTYYDEHKDEYDSVDYEICEIKADMPVEETEAETESETETETMTEEEQKEAEAAKEAKEAEKKAAEDKAMADAKAAADEMLGKITDQASFAKLSSQYASNSTAEVAKTNIKKSSISPTELADWLYDSARKAGDTTVIENTNSNAYEIVYFEKRYLDKTKTVDVRHILISPDTTSEDGEEVDTEQAKADAKAKAEALYAEWKAGDATEDSFAKLAEENTSDSGSASNGGLYEGVTKGSMVTPFDEWIFDSTRKPGDTDIVETDYGYHIMYFVGDGDEAWHSSIENTIRSDRMDEFMTALKENCEVTDKKNHLPYLKISETETATETETETVSETASESETE